MRDPGTPGAFALILTLAAAGAACSGATVNGSVHTGGSIASANPSATVSTGIPNPFTVIARYSAASLGLKNPRHLAIGADGNLYITDDSDRVTVVSPAGKVLRRWGHPGTGPGEFSFVSIDNLDPSDVHASIAVGRDGKVYVSDSGNHRIEVFSPTGTFIRQFGSFGLNDGQFLAPFDLAVDAQGNVYVADDQQETLSKFSPGGHFEWSIGGVAATDPDLQGGMHLANVDSHGRVVVAVSEAGRIVYIDAAGHKVDVFATAPQGGPCNVTVNGAGDTVVGSCPPDFDTRVFDRTHHLVGEWHQSPFETDAAPRFGPNSEVFAIGQGGSILELKVALPGA